MFDSNPITNDTSNPIQQPSGALLLSHICLIHYLDEIKNMAIEIETVDLKSHISACQKRNYQWSEFFELMENIASDDPFKLHFGLIGIRKLLSNLILQISFFSYLCSRSISISIWSRTGSERHWRWSYRQTSRIHEERWWKRTSSPSYWNRWG